MTDEIDLLATIKPVVSVRAVPPPLDWVALQRDEPAPAAAPSRARPKYWGWLAAAAAVIVAIGVAIVVRRSSEPNSAAPSSAAASVTGTPSASATHQPTLTPRLAELADIAEATPINGDGDIRYAKYTTWWLTPQGQSHDKVTREVWIASDTSGKLVASPEPTSGPKSGNFPAGQGIQVHQWCWSNDAPTVRADAATTVPGETGANGWMWTLEYCAGNGPVAPVAQATLLRQIATEPGVTYHGVTQDPIGRSGEMFSSKVDGPGPGLYDTTRIYLDPQTGRLLAIARTTAPPEITEPTYVSVVESVAMVAKIGDRP